MIHSISALPAFQDNYIWILTSDDGRSICAVDPGDPAPVQAYIEANDLRLDCLLITHHHPDHTGGIAALAAQHHCRVIGPQNPAIAGITESVAEGDSVEVMGSSLRVLEVPGHTLDHIAFIVPSDTKNPSRLLCGDTLFAGGCGRLFEGTPEQMLGSLNKLAELPTETEVYCTHEYTQANLRFAKACEPANTELSSRAVAVDALRAANEMTLPSTLGLELATNPFLRCKEEGVIAAAEKFSGVRPATTVEAFAAIRAWKDEF